MNDKKLQKITQYESISRNKNSFPSFHSKIKRLTTQINGHVDRANHQNKVLDSLTSTPVESCLSFFLIFHTEFILFDIP